MDANDRRIARIADWMRGLGAAEYELRCKGDVIDAIAIDDSSDLIAVVTDLVDAAEIDCDTEGGKTRQYTIVGLTEGHHQHVCPVRLRMRSGRATTDAIVSSLAKQNTDLHESLLKERKEGFSMLVTYAETVSRNYSRIVAENERNAERASEVITRLENLRTKELERQMARERHEKDIEIRDRITDGLLPLAMAIGHRVTKGALPPINMVAKSLTAIAQGMNESQMVQIRAILGPDLWLRFDTFWTRAVEGAPDVEAFRQLVNDMSSEQTVAITSALNMGQQAALQEILLTWGANGATASH